jgi:hypothetical protein
MKCSRRSSIQRTGRPSYARQERHQQVFGIDVALAAEAAADIGRDATDARLGHAQKSGGLPAHPMHDLRDDQIVSVSLRGSYALTTPRHSIGTAA